MMQLEDWLDDLCVRFIINIPQEELIELERICFQIEEAQWFYEDFIRPLDPKLPSLGLKPFFQRIISRCPVFKDRPHEDWASAYDRFILYKNRVPVRGAIMLNEKMDHVLLVKGWKKTATWSFPRGKINKDEEDIDCAIREAWEETGFDIKKAGKDKDRHKIRPIEKILRDQSVKLFIFRGVPMDYPFVPQTRKEISKCEWYKIADLPTSHKAKHAHQEGSGHHLIVNANKFYMVAPFVQELKKIISQLRKADHRQSSRLAAPPTDVETLEAQHIGEPSYMATEAPVGMSPAVPSSLPEVHHTPPDHSLRLKHQINLPLSSHLEKNNPAMSNALLSMLRGAPVAEMRIDPQTPLEQPALLRQVDSPAHITFQTDTLSQSPPPAEMQQTHLQRVVSNDQNQLNQHARSLLDVFSRPKVQNPVLDARQQLAPSKQDLLAAFMSKPRTSSTTQQNQGASTNHGNNLLQMLQRTPTMAEASTQTVAPAPAENIAPTVQEIAAVGSPAQIQHTKSNPLLDLLKTDKSVTAVNSTAASIPISAEVPATPLADTFRQVEPAELSAVSDNEKKPSPADAMKANILSMLDSMPPKSARTNEKDRLRKGSTAANLSGPIVQPQFDAIKAPVSEDDMKRPTTGPRKLFDPKNDDFRPTPIKITSRHDDRTRQKSPRLPRHQKPNHATHSAASKEPKDLPKPFQPQILKRPQTAESEDSQFVTPSTLALPAEGLLNTMTTQSPDLSFVKPSTPNVPRNISGEIQPKPSLPTISPVPITPTTVKPTVPQDPQREALLSLLRTPTQAPPQPQPPKSVSPLVDQDETPRSHLTAVPFTTSPPQIPRLYPQPILVHHPSPSAIPSFSSHIVSPVNEMDIQTTRSRVSSLASMNGLGVNDNAIISKEGSSAIGRLQPEKRQTAAGDKAFLMSYLKGFANQGAEAS